MSPRKPVVSLYNLSQRIVCKRILVYVKHHKCPEIRKLVHKDANTVIGKLRSLKRAITRNYNVLKNVDVNCKSGVMCPFLANGRDELSVLSSTVAQLILEKLLSNQELLSCSQYFTRRIIYLLLMRSDFNQLQFFRKGDFAVLTKANKNLMTNTEVLSLSGPEAKFDPTCGVHAALRQIPLLFPKLLNIEITDVADIDEVLSTIGTCSKLLLLKVLGYRKVTNEGLQKLCYADFPENSKVNPVCKYIECIDLGLYQDLKLSVVADFLSHTPNLRNFDWCKETGRVLANLVDLGRCYPRNIESVYETSASQNVIETLFTSGAFDRLSKICLIRPENDAILELPHVTSLTKVELFNVDAESVTHFLLQGGSKLLELILFIDTGVFNLSIIAACCRSLKVFLFQSKEFKFTPVLPFKEIETFFLDNTCSYHNDEYVILSVMKSLPKIKILRIDDCESLIDEHIISLFTSNVFHHLEQIFLFNCVNLTTNAFRYLVWCCPNLRVAGSIADCGEFEEILFAMLRSYLPVENMDMKFV